MLIVNRADQVNLWKLRTRHKRLKAHLFNKMKTGHVPQQNGSNDQRATSPAMPAAEHPVEDRLARGSAPDGEAVWDLAALRRMGTGSPKENGDMAALRRTVTWQP